MSLFRRLSESLLLDAYIPLPLPFLLLHHRILLLLLLLRKGDRFIPNRNAMDFDLCRHLLLNDDNVENEPQAGSDAPAPLQREFQQALRNTLLSPAAGSCCRGGTSSKDAGSSGGRGAGIAPVVLAFNSRPPPPQELFPNVLKVYLGSMFAVEMVDFLCSTGGSMCACVPLHTKSTHLVSLIMLHLPGYGPGANLLAKGAIYILFLSALVRAVHSTNCILCYQSPHRSEQRKIWHRKPVYSEGYFGYTQQCEENETINKNGWQLLNRLGAPWAERSILE